MKPWLRETKETAARDGSCTRKVRYPSRVAAAGAIRYYAEHMGSKAALYRCKFCNGFHLTSRPRRA